MTHGPTDPPDGSPSNRSLQRGVDLLRAFRPGSELLGNGELAERTGLPKATVSRLTQTLVGSGLLQWDGVARAYRLAPAVLSLAHAMRAGSRVLSAAAPLMRELAESQRVNVGLAAPDGDEMVYLESIRYARRVALRHVVSGQRVPMALTSLGRAYLAVAPAAERQAILATAARRRSPQPWPVLARAIDDAARQIERRGFCAASWQPEVVALATPLEADGATYVLNLSLSTAASVNAVAEEYGEALLKLRERLARQLDITRG
ncbi:IclR family transcriptional regulator [uncultured Pseudacidovorax sp.]|uniref:IclR family transcriptional regulator n=1 Tax=uncultured Pseudacidovorax sp. TaxID=679313 RepID=UPI0025F9BF2F|nr:IclR family transcriptional regulator [uncultured Pseudacidovorax sp.]